MVVISERNPIKIIPSGTVIFRRFIWNDINNPDVSISISYNLKGGKLPWKSINSGQHFFEFNVTQISYFFKSISMEISLEHLHYVLKNFIRENFLTSDILFVQIKNVSLQNLYKKY
jgi:hypothetical protein